MSKRSALHMGVSEILEHQKRHGFKVPAELLGDKNAKTMALKPKGKLRRQREPNQTEREFGQVLAAMQRRGEIEYFGFEEITLRWSGMTYTPDYFVIRHRGVLYDGGPVAIEAVYYEVKGGYKWEDSVIKYKAARDRFNWAEFQMWQKQEGQWSQVA